MRRELLLCIPASDGTFRERVSRLVGTHPWDLRSPEGIALVQDVLRETYPSATVTAPGAFGDGNEDIVTVHRDGGDSASSRAFELWSSAASARPRSFGTDRGERTAV